MNQLPLASRFEAAAWHPMAWGWARACSLLGTPVLARLCGLGGAAHAAPCAHLTTNTSTVKVRDLANNATTDVVLSGPVGNGLAVNAAGDRVFVASPGGHHRIGQQLDLHGRGWGRR